MARTYKDASGLNKQSEFGVLGEDATLLFTHKFKWKPSEYVMFGAVIAVGIFLGVFVEPMYMGLLFVIGGVNMIFINANKKKKSLLELYQTKDGLKLFHNKMPSESSTHEDMKMEDVVEIVVAQTHPLPKLILKSAPIAENEFKTIKLPIRFLRSPEFQEFINSKTKSGELKVSKQVLEEMSNWTK